MSKAVGASRGTQGVVARMLPLVLRKGADVMLALRTTVFPELRVFEGRTIWGQDLESVSRPRSGPCSSTNSLRPGATCGLPKLSVTLQLHPEEDLPATRFAR